ncbi:MAG: Asp-tRNA(Asn)/Glu-tRNA(Gln) amidotransferase subunit GatC [Saprospiraceae bacterium]|nr:Asp-tRNA(Asn)/Glu-tRNA(Gln) amidotransferase subunit GatC [Saprospiraceae bacterium]
MKIDDQLITKLETLSRLKLHSDEKSALKNDLASIVSMFDKIGEVDTEDVIPLRHMTHTTNVMRPDQPNNGLLRSQGLKMHLKSSDNILLCPK